MESIFQNRKAKYRKTHKTISLSFSLLKAKALREEALKHGKTSPEFLKGLLDACLQGTGYVIPKENNLQELLIAMRRVGSNINQIVRHVHVEGVVTHTDIEQLQKHLQELEKEMKSALILPPSIDDFLTEYLLEHPEKLQPLVEWLNQYHHDNKSTSC